MELFEAIKKRQSYRGGFTNQTVPREDLVKIVQAGLDAPSGKNCQTTTFVIADDPAVVNQIAQMHTTNKAMQQARAFIACIIDKNPAPSYEGYAFQVEDCAASVENMLLAITALGYGSVWIDGWLRLEGRNEAIGRLLGVPDDKIVRVLLPVGIPSEEYKRPAKKAFNERAWFNRYGLSG
ncbi:MAG TPA: nitroreductase family protein [Anaerohalosphaeraceae bacterium]|nr:nitroreductase family protein [Phycisphaerae bacterium]HOK95317.1 nitroreductase family protein [Anaerohalosphaeraceae bacterium]HOL31495.1 nitroreductase family protein [Anaerohalosphaeraceae bacterium]HOM76158.1 nitroreductase family protein [Anaerohalosphaeraceae bacterium]HPC65046.1 nitroreductase family protein [Anaerohalosphaeraceae bacterium]